MLIEFREKGGLYPGKLAGVIYLFTLQVDKSITGGAYKKEDYFSLLYST